MYAVSQAALTAACQAVMATLAERCKEAWNIVSHSPAKVPTELQIPADRVDKGPVEPFVKDEHYFEVRVNEMFLSAQRKWFVEYLPMVMVISEFTYEKAKKVVPFVVGPSLIEKDGITIPKTGMVFRDTRVAGRHPYKGGQMALAVILYRVQRNNYARKLLDVIETAAGVMDFATALSPYLKVADVVMQGLEALTDSAEVEPVVGLRWEFDPSEKDVIKSGYFALINRPEGNLEESKLQVKGNQLLYGGNPSPPVRPSDADYVLYSVLPKPERKDYEVLPFQAIWDRVLAEATQPSASHWKSAKANMTSLYQTITASPDLTWKQAGELTDLYVARMKVAHEKAVKLAKMSGKSPPETAIAHELDSAREKSLSVLDL